MFHDVAGIFSATDRAALQISSSAFSARSLVTSMQLLMLGCQEWYTHGCAKPHIRFIIGELFLWDIILEDPVHTKMGPSWRWLQWRKEIGFGPLVDQLWPITKIEEKV